MIKKEEKNIIGLLGTIILHLTIIIVFLIVKITTSSSKIEESILIDFTEEEPENVEEKEEKKKIEDKEFWEWYKNEIRSNAAVNAEHVREDISTEKYIDEIQDELNEGREPIDIPELDDGEIAMDSPKEKKKESGSKYSVRTNITWELDKRNKKRIANPVYLCEGSGDVKVEIHVNQKGAVVGCSIISSTGNDCLEEAALDAAKKSYFNIDFDASLKQKGWILFSFVAQ
ncbi:MAG: energy transducer TonB [bacterium]